MQYLKIGAHQIPLDVSSRSGWAVQMLRRSIDEGLAPVPVAEALVTRFTACLPDAVAKSLQARSTAAGQSPAMMAAMLIAAAQQGAQPVATLLSTHSELVGETLVRPELQSLLRQAWQGLEHQKIVFAEAATGTGKGRLIASLAVSSVKKGRTTVVTAPLAVVYQLIAEVQSLQTEVKPNLLLGRSNFVDPVKIEALLDDDRPALRKWFEDGGRPQAQGLREFSESLHLPLCWLAEEAMALDDDLPIAECLLEAGAAEDNPAEMAYQAAFKKVGQLQQAGESPLVFCSHLMLAADSRLHTLQSGNAEGLLPTVIDTLIIDEAHLLEQSFAAVHASTVHLHATKRHVQEAGFPAATRKSLEGAVDRLIQTMALIARNGTVTGRIDTFVELIPSIRALASELKLALNKRESKSKAEGSQAARTALGFVRYAMDTALSGYATLQVGATPVRGHPLFTCGRDNLEKNFGKLWDRVKASVLISATLYTPDAMGQMSAKHLRWVLSVPKNRAEYPTPVIPKWVTETALLTRLPSELFPDDSEAWLDQTAEQLKKVYRGAAGGTLALCTSFATVEALAARVSQYAPDVIVQSGGASASRCAQLFRQQAAAGRKPLWLGVGSAWTGIDLADNSVSAEQDLQLTDLFIPRLPYGCNRTLTHHRRVKSLDFMVEVHETARMLKQGLGRLIRREGLKHRHIWLADSRLTDGAPHRKPLLKLLSAYRSS